jgi:hypothetical protein
VRSCHHAFTRRLTEAHHQHIRTRQDPAEAIAAAPHRKARQAALAAAAALTHHATAVAASPCKLLVLSAGDLRRFGRRVRAPLAAAAAARRDWVHARREAVRVRA